MKTAFQFAMCIWVTINRFYLRIIPPRAKLTWVKYQPSNEAKTQNAPTKPPKNHKKLIFRITFCANFQNAPNASECIQTHPNGPKCIRAGPNRSEQVQTDPKTQKNLRKRQKNRENSRNNRDSQVNFARGCGMIIPSSYVWAEACFSGT